MFKFFNKKLSSRNTTGDKMDQWKPAIVDEYGKVHIQVHPLTDDPKFLWQKLSVKQTLEPLSSAVPVLPNHVRFVCMSDTHNRINSDMTIPDGDVFIHAGDFSMVGAWEEIRKFNDWIGSLPHKYKIVIAGNHELSFDETTEAKRRGKQPTAEELASVGNVRALLTNCIYLEDSEVQVGGIRIYGSPWQPEFGGWAFNLPRGQECLNKWNMIPEGIDVLVTHGPPRGHGDLCSTGIRAGCVELLHTIQHRVKPKYHIFGHIHEDSGITTDGQTIFINATTCNLRYKAVNPPIIFDLPLREGFTKDSISLVSSASVISNQETVKQAVASHVPCSDMEVDINDHITDDNFDKAENFMSYCEIMNMSDSLSGIEIEPNCL